MSNLKEALIECLQGSLSPEGDVRRGAEERLKALEVTENHPIHLMEIVLDNGDHCLPPPIRQLASVILRQYIDTHWTSITEKFVAPEPSEQAKAILRSNLPIGLTYSESKIRNSIAAIISTIAHWDWPEQWPNLFEVLLQYLHNEKSVAGAMRVLTEFVKELTEEHLLQVAPIILPEMSVMINDKESYSSNTRARAVQVFRTCARVISILGQIDKKAPTRFLDPVLQNYVQVFTRALMEPENPGHYKLKKDIIKTVTVLLRYYQAKTSPYLAQLLPPAWAILTSLTVPFKAYLQGNEDDDDNIDSDGEKCGIESTLYAIFELVQALLENPQIAKTYMSDSLTDLIFYTTFYMQLPQERVEQWTSNPSSFASDEDEDSGTYSLRACAQDLLSLVSDEFNQQCIAALGQAVNRHLCTPAGQTDWRLQEACLYAVCSLGTNVAKPWSQSSGIPTAGCFDIHGFVQNIVIPGLSSQDILLVGRCLVLGSNFCTVIDPTLTENFIRAAVECLQPDRSIILKLLATKAIESFVNQSPEYEFVHKKLLEFLPVIVENLITFGAMGQSVDILTIVLETLTEILKLDDGFTASIGSKVTTLSIACFVKFNADPVICPIIEGILQILCKNRNCVVEVQERLTPTLISVLNNSSTEMAGPQGVALDLLTVVIRASPTPLSPMLVTDAFPAVINCITKSDDHTVWQNGGECLRAYTSVAPDQVYEYRDANGMSGLAYVVQIACRLLDPTMSEFSATLVGKLVTTLLSKTGNKLGDQLELLLRAVLSKLRSADTLSVIQNLLMVYAYLFNTQLEPALNFLDSVPGPTGQSALYFVMTEWVSRQHMFYGMFDRKVSSIALANLLLHGLNTKDPRVTQIQVKGELVDTKQMITRSKKKTEEWTKIPLLVKIFKLLIYELSCVTADTTADEEGETESESEDDDKENGVSCSGFNVEDLLFDDEESGVNVDDQDILSDPIYTVDLSIYLKDFLTAFSQQPHFPEFISHLNVQELKALSKIGLNIG
ncbi:importin-9 [Folsomia candida]|uniref:importin-9 n=1 Tax=Folsomia candida TaxID=158441 RepID=UPI000B8F4353|nr:importin-9 [Folsomia candida]